MAEHYFMYCPKCGWMNSEEGIGKAQCPVCISVAQWVRGTVDELTKFRSAISANPRNWKRFRCTDYWIGSPEDQK